MAKTPSYLPSPRSSACCEPLIDAALKTDIAFLEKRLGAQELAVEAAERRAAIPGHKARGIETVAAVEFLLHQAEPHQRLEAGHEHAALAEVVFIVEFDVAQRHRQTSRGASLPL
jgi:hypothetical protein